MTTQPLRFGVQTGQQNVTFAQLAEAWAKADAWGYDSLWVFDHFFPIFTDPEGPCLEGWTTLAALSQVTKRARLGAMVNGNTYRNPCLTAKMGATLDHASGGRFVLGIGAGWFEPEHRAFGIDFETVRGRLEALEESLRIIRGMWTQPKTTLRGKHYTVEDAMGNPRPVQTPHPPILIGGTGEKVLLRLVAQYADMWNMAGPASVMAHKIEVIRRHGDRVGRDPARIEHSVMLPLCYRASAEREAFVQQLVAGMRGTTPEAARESIMIGGKDECLETIARYGKAGVTHFVFMTFAPYVLDELQAFAEEVAPAARG
ncbi:MAG: LLM class F420-dependent oxidoreductase [bacterium]|nr:LLM class F420-dependent oxidoreductase [bacterium]